MSDAKDLERRIGEAARILVDKKRCVALTGAGVSVPSGIPDFRSKGGLWEKFDPGQYATSTAWKRSPAKVWEMLREVGRLLMASRPNPAHTALAELERLGVCEAVITQNIDGLHQEAGSRTVIEFHGNGRDLFCPECGRRSSREEEARVMESAGTPSCPSCGAVIRPAVVLFGEPIPMEAMVRSFRAAENCRVMLVIGTSGLVAPASTLPSVAGRAGAVLIEINLAPTAMTPLADLSLFSSVDEALPAVVAEVRALLGSSYNPTSSKNKYFSRKLG